MIKTPLHIGRTIQLFLDNQIVDMIQAVTRRVHRPAKSADNPVITKDRPWEQMPFFRTGNMCVAFDPVEDVYKCWYEDYAWDYERYMQRKGRTSGLVPPGWFETTDMKWLYAESKDGLHWQKPELDICQIDGRKTNVCLQAGQGGQMYVGCMFLDPLEKDQAKRFKGLYWQQTQNQTDIRLGYSPDGRKWTLQERNIVVGGVTEQVFGDEFMIYPDTALGQYLLTVRHLYMGETLDFKDIPCRVENNWEPPYYVGNPLITNKRRVYSAASNRLSDWPTLREMLVPNDVDDNIDDEFYSMPMVRIGDLYIAFLNVLHGTDNTMDVQLLYSRDAFNWQRVTGRSPYLECGNAEEGAWDPYLVEVGNSVILRDDGIRIYYGGSACHHDWWMWGEKEGLKDMPDEPGVCKTAMGLATLRPEGFVSLSTTIRPGMVLTHPFTSDGEKLLVNVECEKDGYFQAALTDMAGKEIPGYEKGSCDIFEGDDASHIVSWAGKTQLPRQSLAEGARLCFYSRKANLYSFKIV